jgi:uncharacterized protein YggE
MNRVIAIVVTAFFLQFTTWEAEAAEDTLPRTITVQGTGSVTATPDQATIVTGVVTRAGTASGAISDNNHHMAKLFETLTRFGIPERHRQTSAFSVHPVYGQRPPQPLGPGQQPAPPTREIVAFEARNQLSVIVEDLSNVGNVLGALIRAGSNVLGGVRFSTKDRDRLIDAARVKAMQDAKRRAGIYAKEAGIVVGKVIQINEGGAIVPFRPMLARSAAAESLPLAPGEQHFTAQVTVTFAIQ